LAGRVEGLEENGVYLADALGKIRVIFSGSEGTALNIGDLVVLRGRFERRSFFADSIVSHDVFPEPRGTGEFARFRWQGQGERLVKRAQLTTAIRRWFDTEGFIEVHTPTLLEAPGLDSGVDAITAEGGYLVTSPELAMKRLLVGGMPRIYQFAICFRRDEHGPIHQREFTMLEWYRAFCDLPQILEDTETLIVALAEQLGLASSLVVGQSRISLERPFLRISVDDAFRQYAGVDDVSRLAERDPSKYFELLVSRVEPALAKLDKPVFLTRYPATQAALSRRCRDDARFAERAELYVAGVELCNAYGELSSAEEQRQRFEEEIATRRAHGQPEYPLDEGFLTALSEGMPQSAGNALGLDRLMMLLLGRPSIADTLAFPL
jgi:lysyl-tRNA synthetase class 2